MFSIGLAPNPDSVPSEFSSEFSEELLRRAEPVEELDRDAAIGTTEGGLRRGEEHARETRAQAAWAAVRTKGSYVSARYRRLASRRGKKRAILAVAHTLLRRAFVLQKTHGPYRDWGADYFDRLHPQRLTRYHVKRLQQLGYQVQLQPDPATA